MATIRLAVIEQIKRQFDNTVFSKHSFEFSFNKDGYILRIQFVHNLDLVFEIQEYQSLKQGRYKFSTIESPGQVSNEAEIFDHELLNNAQSRAQQWANRIEEDYRISVPEESELESFRKEFFESFDNQTSDNEYFTEDERLKVNDKMEAFEAKLEEFYKEKEATNQQLNEMKRQIDILRKGVEILDKRTWLSAACNRVFDIVKEVRGAKKEIKTLLGDMNSIGNLLPDNSAESEEAVNDEA